MNPANPHLFLALGKILIGAAFGAALIKSLKDGTGLTETFIRLTIGFLALVFFEDFFRIVKLISDGLSEMIASSSRNGWTLKELLSSIYAASEPKAETSESGLGSTFRGLVNALGQAFKTGVWGVVTSVVELIFLLSQELLVSARDVMWQLAIVLFPLAAGVSPLFPGILFNLSLFSVEVALWVPVLTLINAVIGMVAHSYLIGNATRELRPDLGISIIAVELMSIILIFSIPSATNRIVSGAMSGDLNAGPSGVLGQASSIKNRTISLVSFSKLASYKVRGKLKAFSICIAVLAAETVYASVLKTAPKTITLYPGYVSRLNCRGKLLITSLGNEDLAAIAPVPGEFGCTTFVKPMSSSGHSNLFIESSTGSYSLMIELEGTKKPTMADLSIDLGSGD